MDIIKKILCFTLLGDLLFFEKKSKEIEEANLMYKMYRINGMIIFICLCTIVIMYGIMLIPFINFIMIFVFLILIYIFLITNLIYVLVRNIVLLKGYKKMDLNKFDEKENNYLSLIKNNIYLILSLYAMLPLALLVYITFLFQSLYILSLFLTVTLLLIIFILSITKIVFYVISRFKLYSIIKSDKF